MAKHAQKPAPKKRGRKTKKTSAGRILLRVCSALLSVAFLAVGGSILYVRGLLGRLDRTEFTGFSSFSYEDYYPTYSEEAAPSEAESDTPSETESAASEEKPVSSAPPKVDVSQLSYNEAQKIPVLSDPDIQNILLIGTDSVGIGDTSIIVSINRRTKKIHLTSVMRAVYVKIPDRQWFLFNHAYAWGGPRLVLRTLEENLRIRVDDYMVVNFKNFPRVIDLMGGLDMRLTAVEADYLTNDIECPGEFQAGTAHLNGAQALSYVRMRNTDSDFNRTNRQRNVIQALIGKATSMGVAQLNDLAVNLMPMINTSLSNGEILSLAAGAPAMLSYPISQKMVPVENDTTGSTMTTYYGRTLVRYPNASFSVEAYRFDFPKNIKALQDFIRS